MKLQILLYSFQFQQQQLLIIYINKYINLFQIIILCYITFQIDLQDTKKKMLQKDISSALAVKSGIKSPNFVKAVINPTDL